MKRLLPLILLALFQLGQASYPYPGPGRGPTAAAALCPGSFLFCQDFEISSTNDLCDTEVPDATSETGATNHECDCGTADTSCIGAAEPATVPNGSAAMMLSHESFKTDAIVEWRNLIDNADSSDTQWYRYCFNPLVAEPTPQDVYQIAFLENAARWDDTASFGAIFVELDATPRIKIQAPHNGGTVQSGFINMTQSLNAWNEISFCTVESTGVVELCVNQAMDGTCNGNDSTGCVGLDGTDIGGLIDGIEFFYDEVGFNQTGAFVIDAFRVQTATFGALQGCSGL